MGTNKTLSVFLKLNSKAFTTGLKKIEGKLNRFSRKLNNIGTSLSTNVSLPLLGVGAAAVKTASDFSASMTKIQTLVGLPKESVEQLSNSVLELSGVTAQAPKDLADGLYFLTSAGLSGESALKALEATAKGSAAGLGDMESLATVAAAAQNAYGEEVLTSSGALDIFGKMVQTGMFKSEELASVLGSQLGLASNLGISMEELGSMISAYTRTTGSATDATTGLSGIMMSFAKVGTDAEKSLKKATEGMKEGGMSADDLRKMLGEDGLQKTLLFLQTQFENSGIPLSKFFTKSQALKGALGVLGVQSESYIGILEEMEKSQGFVNNAFDTTTEESAFKFKRALADLKVSGIKLGESLMPIATKIATVFSNLARSFSGMSEESRQRIVKLGMALVALGPTLVIIGKIVSAFSFVIKAVRTARVAVIAFGRGMMLMSGVGAIIGGIVIAIGWMAKNWDLVKEKLVNVINWVIGLYNEFQLARIAVEGIGFAFGYVWEYFKVGIKNIVDLFKGLGNVIVAALDPRKSVKEAWEGMVGDMVGNITEFTSAVDDKWSNMMDNITTKKQVELITEEDIDNTLNNMKTGVEGVIGNIQDSVGGLFDNLLNPDTGGGVDHLELDGIINVDGVTYGDDLETDEDGNPVITIDGQLDTEGIEESMDQISSATQQAFSAVADSQEGGIGAMVEQVRQGARDAIKAHIANATVAWAKSAFENVPMPASAILAATAGVVVGGIFNAIIPPFAQGGMVSGPTLAMVGEGSGTSMVNPEVIAPLDKLKGMIGGGGGLLHGSISGSDILLTNDRSTRTQDRVGGSVTDF